jgi:hypothetical protein
MHTEQNKKTEEILNSLDGISKAAAPDFFYTRLEAKMVARLGSNTEAVAPGHRAWALRPAYAVAALVVVLLINSFVLLQKNSSGSSFGTTDTESIQSIASEYRLNDNSNLYDLTQDK